MKTITKKIISLAICAIMVFSTLSVGGVIDFEALAATVASGSCGSNVTWSIDSDTGELLISGTGSMENYYYLSHAPWRSYSDKFTKVTIEDGVTSIGDSAFYGCTGLTSITIPDSVTSIGYGAFQNCTGLTSITIPDSVTSIGQYAFSGCTRLTSINVTENNSNYCSIDGVLFNKDKTELICYPEGKTDTSYSISDSVTSIGHSAFRGHTGLTSVTIPDSVTSIGDWAFSSCTGLTSITIPDSVTSIGEYAFLDCTNLKTVYYTGDIAKWCAIVFEDGYSNPTYYASELYINGVKVEGTLKIPNGVTRIGYSAFRGYTGLTSITIPDSVTSIRQSAFDECSNLGTVYYTGTPTQWSKISIGSNNSYLTSATIVYECNSDKSYSQGGVCGDDLFYKFYTDTGELIICGTGSMESYFSTKSYSSSSDAPWHSYRDKITKVTIEDGVTTIGEYAFYDCTGLTTIEIGSSVESISSSAFEDCTSLVNITIPDSVTCVYCDTFDDTAYYNDETKWENGKVLYIGNHLIKAKDTLSGNYEIKKGTKDISDYAFSGCTSLTEITIPDSVVTIGESAFKECSCLLSVSIGNGVKTIGGQAFSNCKSLQDIKLGNNITTIGGGAFNECTNIKSITIPDSVTSIGGGAFYKTGLTSVKIPRTVTSIGEGAFGSTSDFFGYIYDRDFTIYCEKGSEAHRYAAANDLNCVLVNDASTGNNSSNGSNSGGSSLSFFQRIIAFFKGIFQSIKNLFS